MNQNGIVGIETSVEEPKRIAPADLPQPGTELSLANTELAIKERDALDARLKESTGLTLSQIIVLEALGGGHTVREAAKMGKVHAATIYRWLSDHAAFITHHQKMQRDILAAARTRLAALTDRAIDAVERQIGVGDGRLGLELLREMKVTPKSMDEPRASRHSETVVERVQQSVSVTTREMDVKTETDDKVGHSK